MAVPDGVVAKAPDVLAPLVIPWLFAEYKVTVLPGGIIPAMSWTRT